MLAFTAHLDKEWREQRRGLLALLVLAALAPLASLLLPAAILPERAPIAFIAALCFGSLAALMLASDLVPREVARGGGGVDLLARLPRGLAGALHGKLLVYIVGTASVALLAWSAGSITDGLRGGLDARVWGFNTTFVLFVALALAPWLFAASTIVTRGMWTVPIALLTSWPAVVMTLVLVELSNNDTQRVLAFALNAAAAYSVARVAFIGGHTRGRSPRRTVLHGAVALAGVCVPLAGYMAREIWMANTVDPTRADFRIEAFYLDPTGQCVWVQAFSKNTPPYLGTTRAHRGYENCRPLIVDVDDGAWEFAGPHGATVYPGSLAFDGEARPGYGLVQVSSSGSPKDAIVVRNASTATELTDAERVALARTHVDFQHWWSWRGRGATHVTGTGDLDRVYVDRVTGLEVLRSELAEPGNDWVMDVIVRQGSWVLVHRRGALELLDPVTKERRPAPAELIDISRRAPLMLPDGRFAVLGDEQRLIAIDPDAPESAVEFEGLAERFGRIAVEWLDQPWSWSEETRGSLLTRVVAENGEPHYVALSFDPPRVVGVVTSSGSVGRSGAWLDDTRALVLEDGRRLVEIDFEHGTRRVVFPR